MALTIPPSLITCYWQQIKLAEEMVIGNDFEVRAQMTNNCMKTKTFKAVFLASAVDYNGKLREHCGFATEEVSLAPDEGSVVLLRPSLEGKQHNASHINKG